MILPPLDALASSSFATVAKTLEPLDALRRHLSDFKASAFKLAPEDAPSSDSLDTPDKMIFDPEEHFAFKVSALNSMVILEPELADNSVCFAVKGP